MRYQAIAVKAFARLPEADRRRVKLAVERLARDPFASPHLAPLHGELAGLHRLRVGDVRVVLEIRTGSEEILVMALGQRGGVYR